MSNTISVSQLHDLIEKQVIIALEKEGIAIMNYLKEKIETDIYNTYTPFQYERTMELYDCIKMKVNKIGDELVLQVYIEDKKHTYNPTWFGQIATYPEIFDKFKEGFYGRDRGYDVIGDLQEEWLGTQKAISFLANELKKKFKIVRL